MSQIFTPHDLLQSSIFFMLARLEVKSSLSATSPLFRISETSMSPRYRSIWLHLLPLFCREDPASFTGRCNGWQHRCRLSMNYVRPITYWITRETWRRYILNWASQAIRLLESSTRRSPLLCCPFPVNHAGFMCRLWQRIVAACCALAKTHEDVWWTLYLLLDYFQVGLLCEREVASDSKHNRHLTLSRTCFTNYFVLCGSQNKV